MDLIRSEVVSESARSLPAIPMWLGIHAKLVSVLLDFRLSIVSLIRGIKSFVVFWLAWIAGIDELESLKRIISDGVPSRLKIICRAW